MSSSINQKTFKKIVKSHFHWLCDGNYSPKAEQADFQFLRLEDLYMNGCDLREALFMGASFFGVSMERADLRDAEFERCNLGDTNLQYALLQGADFTGADLREANLKNAFYDNKTEFPRNFDPVAAGMILVAH